MSDLDWKDIFSLSDGRPRYLFVRQFGTVRTAVKGKMNDFQPSLMTAYDLCYCRFSDGRVESF